MKMLALSRRIPRSPFYHVHPFGHERRSLWWKRVTHVNSSLIIRFLILASWDNTAGFIKTVFITNIASTLRHMRHARSCLHNGSIKMDKSPVRCSSVHATERSNTDRRRKFWRDRRKIIYKNVLSVTPAFFLIFCILNRHIIQLDQLYISFQCDKISYI
jgi:hypothetical protein